MGFLCDTIIYSFTTKYYRSHYKVLKKRKIMNKLRLKNMKEEKSNIL